MNYYENFGEWEYIFKVYKVLRWNVCILKDLRFINYNNFKKEGSFDALIVCYI